MKTYVLFHGNCFDGMGAAWAARRYFDDRATYHPVVYGQPPPEMDEGSAVVIVDFSYPRAVILELLERHAEVTLLDHHATAQSDLTPWPEGLHGEFDMGRSGAGITWDWFKQKRHRPTLIDYLEDRDLWRFKLPFSREASAVVNSYPFTFEAYDELHLAFQNDLGAVADEGRALLRLIDRQVATMCAQVLWLELTGIGLIPAVNASVFFSEVGSKLLELYPATDVAAYYFDRADGKRQWGLRSMKGFDCTPIARHYGGGGHPQAAGFVSEKGWLP